MIPKEVVFAAVSEVGSIPMEFLRECMSLMRIGMGNSYHAARVMEKIQQLSGVKVSVDIRDELGSIVDRVRRGSAAQ